MKLSKRARQIIALICILTMSLSIIAACGQSSDNGDTTTATTTTTAAPDSGSDEGEDDEDETETTESPVESEDPYFISFMTQYFDSEHMPDDSPVMIALQEYTNTELEMRWTPSSTYDELLNIALASGDMAMITLVPSKLSSIISAVRAGAFWELGSQLGNYPNLSQANEIVLNNISIDGDVYGIYRARDLGRQGIVYRQDWLENVGLPVPSTIDEFYDMLYAFTHEDPNQSGADDTYGMTVTEYMGPWRIMLTWFGAPNKWEEQPDGSLIPEHYTEEFMEGLRFFKKLYDDGLVNQDFAVFDPGSWNDPYRAGRSGVLVDVLDAAGRWEDNFRNDGVEEAKVDVIGAVEGPYGMRNLPTSGFNGMFMIPKESVTTDDDFHQVMTFMDKLGDTEMEDLLGWGIEDRHYYLVDGEIDPVTDDDTLTAELRGSNQMLHFIPGIGTPRTRSELRRKADGIMEENIEIVVGNPAEPYVSDVYARRGAQLDTIINDAIVQFIVGEIDEDGFQEAVNRWNREGGEDYIEEINTLHAEAAS